MDDVTHHDSVVSFADVYHRTVAVLLGLDLGVYLDSGIQRHDESDVPGSRRFVQHSSLTV